MKEEKKYLKDKFKRKYFFNVKEGICFLGGPILGGALPIPFVYGGLEIISELAEKSNGDPIHWLIPTLAYALTSGYGVYKGNKKGREAAMISRGKRREKQKISQLEENLENSNL